LNEDRKAELLNIDPHIKAWGKSLLHARTQAGLDINEVSRKLLLSKNQLLSIETGSMKSFHNVFFYSQALQKYRNLLNIELTPDPETVIVKSDFKKVDNNLGHNSTKDNHLKGVNFKKPGSKLSQLKTSKASYRTNSKFKKKTIQITLISASLIVTLVAAIVLLRSPSEVIQNNVARLNAEVISETIASASTSPAPSDLSSSLSAMEKITLASPSVQTPALQQITQAAKPSQLNQQSQTGQSGQQAPLQATAQPKANGASAVPRASVTTTTNASNQTAQPSAMNILSISFSAACWVQAIDKDGLTVVKTYAAGTTFEQPIKNLKSLVIGNAGAAKAMLGNKPIDLSVYQNTQSSTARLFEKDFASMQ